MGSSPPTPTFKVRRLGVERSPGLGGQCSNVCFCEDSETYQVPKISRHSLGPYLWFMNKNGVRVSKLGDNYRLNTGEFKCITAELGVMESSNDKNLYL